MSSLAYLLTAETSLPALLRAVIRLPEQRCDARFVHERESCTSTWEGGACGWDRREGKGLWVTRKPEPYPTFFGRQSGGWRATVRSELARGWLWLRPAPAPAQVLWDLLIERGFPLAHLPPLAVAWGQRDSLAETYRALAEQALDAASDDEQIAAAWAVR